jgi:flagellar biosynthesis chaperone FliJ
MKKFTFALESLRTLLEREEQATLAAYAQTLIAREQAQHEWQRVNEELAAACDEIESRLSGACPAFHLVQLHAWRLAIEQQGCEREQALVAARAQEQAALQRLLAARRALAAVDKYRELQRVRHQRQCRRLEQQALDDLAQRRTIVTPSPAEETTLWN